ncbi:unnamed protein product [Orchesella dallaii]|uniref:Uncharacterized protein n=1 Tax=Orchesella dallaii TaxID=48710 RepID=A0ABP1Q8N3_9HEXA
MDSQQSLSQGTSSVMSLTQRSLSTPPPPQVVAQAQLLAPQDTPDGIMYIGTVTGGRSVTKSGGRKRAAISGVQHPSTSTTVRIAGLDGTDGGDDQQVIVVAEMQTDKNARARQNERLRRQYSKDQSTRLRELLAPEIHEWLINSGNKKQPNEGQLMYLACEKVEVQNEGLEAKDKLLAEKEEEILRLRNLFGEQEKRQQSLRAVNQKMANSIRHVAKGFLFYKQRYNAQCDASNTQREEYPLEPFVHKVLSMTNVPANRNFLALDDLARRQAQVNNSQSSSGCQGALQILPSTAYPAPTMIRVKQETDQTQSQSQGVVRNNLSVTNMIVGNNMYFQPVRMPVQTQMPQRIQIGQSSQFQQQQLMTHHPQRNIIHQQFLQQGVRNLRITQAPGQPPPNTGVYACNPQEFHQQQPIVHPPMPPQPNFTIKQEPLDMPEIGENANIANSILPYGHNNVVIEQPSTVTIKSEPEDCDTDRAEDNDTQNSGNSASTHSPLQDDVQDEEPAGQGQPQQGSGTGMFSMPGFREDLDIANRTYPQYPPQPPAEEPVWRVMTAEVLLDDENAFMKAIPSFKDFLWHGYLENKDKWKSEVQTIFDELADKTLQECEQTLKVEKEAADAELEKKNKNRGKKRNQEEDNEPKKRGRKKKYGRR